MFRTHLVSLLVILATAAQLPLGGAQEPPAAGSIPPASDAPRPLSPAESRAHFQLPEGFDIALVASEPLIRDPSAILFDFRGRFFVSELHGYNLEGHLDVVELNKTGELDREVRRVRADDRHFAAAKRQRYGVVKQLVDANGDGQLDQALSWADDLPPCYGMVAYRDGLIVVCGPDIVFLADRDGDGQAEIRELLFTGFDVDVMERAINNPRWGLDGWIYVAAGGPPGPITGPHLNGPVALGRTDFRFLPDGTAIEPVTGTNGTFGLALTDYDERFLITTSRHARYAIPLPHRYLRRNPYVPTPDETATAADYHQVFPASEPHPWRTARGANPAWVKFYGAHEATPNGNFTSGCGQMIYGGDLFPDAFDGNHFCCDPSQNLVHRSVVRRDGAGFQVHRAAGEETREFLASTDRWHRPMNLATGPDGAIYIVDLYREIIEDYSAIPRYLQQQYGLIEGHDRGRIWRLAPVGADLTAPPDLTKASLADLSALLSHGNRWRRQAGQRLLIERNATSAGDELRLLATGAPSAASRLRALYTLAALEILTPSDVRQALRDPHYQVRIHALRLCERWAKDDATWQTDLWPLINDDDPSVRLQLALTLGECPGSRAVAALAQVALRFGDQRWMDAAILSSAANREDALIAEVLKSKPRIERADKVLHGLAASLGARGDGAAIGRLLNLAIGSDPDAEMLAVDVLVEGLMTGLERGDGLDQFPHESEAALRALVAAPDASTRLRALRLAKLLRMDDGPLMREIWQSAQQTLGDPATTVDQRHAAVDVLATARWEYRQTLAMLIDLKQPADVQLAAVRGLASDHPDGGPGDEVLASVLLQDFRRLSPSVQEAVVDTFFTRLERRSLLLAAIERGEVSANQINGLRRVQLLESGDPEIRRRAEALMHRATDEQRAAVLEDYQQALTIDGDASRGRTIFQKHCSQCHRLDGLGFEVGPDLQNVRRRPAAALLVDILDPSRAIDPDFTVYTVLTKTGRSHTGVLASESATSMTLRREEAAEDVILRSEIEAATATEVSLMPVGVERTLTPTDLANLFAWLHRRAGDAAPDGIILFDEQADFDKRLTDGGGDVAVTSADAYAGRLALRVTPPQRYNSRIPKWNFAIREHPRDGEFRYLRLAWKTKAADGVLIELADDGGWPRPDDPRRRYFSGVNTTDWQATQVAQQPPTEWTVSTVDLWKDAGDFTLTGIAPTAMGGAALFDKIELLQTLDKIQYLETGE